MPHCVSVIIGPRGRAGRRDCPQLAARAKGMKMTPEEQLEMFGAQLYDAIGGAYSATRCTDPRIAAIEIDIGRYFLHTRLPIPSATRRAFGAARTHERF